MLTAIPRTTKVDDIIRKINDGEIKIPQFQRNFVWDIKMSADLLDSIIKGYPVGAFTFWRTTERLRVVKDIGGFALKPSPSVDYVTYVLDGQQRITSIYACVTGKTIGNMDYRDICIDLTADENSSIVVLKTDGLDDDRYISVSELLDDNVFRNYDSGSDSFSKILAYRERIKGYDFAVIEVSDASVSVATEIFSRINTKGKSLSLFEIMCAKTYDESRDFDLFNKRDTQREAWAKCSYNTIPDRTVLQAISICIKGACTQKDILSIEKDEFIDCWDAVDVAFNGVIDYMRRHYSVPESKLLPYDALLVPFVYYFYLNKKKPNGKNVKRLENYFWRCVLTNRFVQGMEAKLATDCEKVIKPIVNNEDPDEKYLEPVDISLAAIRDNGEFKIGNAYIKGMICLLASLHPRSFDDGSEVELEKALLDKSNSKNYHHFFPKAYMKKKHPRVAKEKVNHIANIAIIDGYSNKVLIKDRAPSDYMADFRKENSLFKETMETHLINYSDFGILNNDYNIFFENRIKRIQKELEKKIIPQDGDKLSQKN